MLPHARLIEHCLASFDPKERTQARERMRDLGPGDEGGGWVPWI
jgi:hypothetical protein